MFRGVYDGVSGMVHAQRMYEVTSHNLANLRVTGHRARRLTVQNTGTAGIGNGVPGPTERIGVSFEPGTLEYTGTPTHVAIKGDGFFVVETPRGELYTRSGAFEIGPDGTLQLAEGHRVLGIGGPLAIPPGSGPVEIGTHGEVYAGGVMIGQLRVVRFADPSVLQPVTANLFAASPQATPVDVPVPELVPGAIEGSNVNPVYELVNLIIASRYYETSQRALTALDAALQNAYQLA